MVEKAIFQVWLPYRVGHSLARVTGGFEYDLEGHCLDVRLIMVFDVCYIDANAVYISCINYTVTAPLYGLDVIRAIAREYRSWCRWRVISLDLACLQTSYKTVNTWS